MKVEILSARLYGDFAKKVKEISREDILSCYQCGMCSAGCPIAFAMDLLPNQIIRLVLVATLTNASREMDNSNQS